MPEFSKLSPSTLHPGFHETKPLQNFLCLLDKPEEIVPASKPSRTAENVAIESRVATIKQRPTSRCFPATSDVNVSEWNPVGFGLAWLVGKQAEGSARRERQAHSAAGLHKPSLHVFRAHFQALALGSSTDLQQVSY